MCWPAALSFSFALIYCSIRLNTVAKLAVARSKRFRGRHQGAEKIVDRTSISSRVASSGSRRSAMARLLCYQLSECRYFSGQADDVSRGLPPQCLRARSPHRPLLRPPLRPAPQAWHRVASSSAVTGNAYDIRLELALALMLFYRFFLRFDAITSIPRLLYYCRKACVDPSILNAYFSLCRTCCSFIALTRTHRTDRSKSLRSS